MTDDQIRKINSTVSNVTSGTESLRKHSRSFGRGVQILSKECARSRSIVKDYWGNKSLIRKENQEQKCNIALSETNIIQGK